MPNTAARTRESYIPTGSTPERDPESDAIVYLYATRDRRPAAVAFVGRQTRPRWHYSFPSEASRRREIDRLFAERRPAAKYRAERAKAHTLQRDAILVCSWGYEQTNVEFYQVIRALPASVELRRIQSNRLEAGAQGMQGTCTPIPNSFIGEPKRYRADGTNSVKIADRIRASPWDGRPRHWSSYA
jgi:hypothetical protein